MSRPGGRPIEEAPVSFVAMQTAIIAMAYAGDWRACKDMRPRSDDIVAAHRTLVQIIPASGCVPCLPRTAELVENGVSAKGD